MVGFLIAVVATGLYALYAASVAIAEYGEARNFDRERAQVARVADEARKRVRRIDLVRAGRQNGDPGAFLAQNLGAAGSAQCDVDDDEVWTLVASDDFGYEDPALVVEEFDLCWSMQPPEIPPRYRVSVRGTEQLRMLAEGARLGSWQQRVDLQRVHSGQALVERVYPPHRVHRHTVRLATIESTLPDLEWRVGEAATSGSDAFSQAMLLDRDEPGDDEPGDNGPAHDAFAHEKHRARDEMHAAVGLRIGVFSEEDLDLPAPGAPPPDTGDGHELPERPWAHELHERLWARMEWASGTEVAHGEMLRARTREQVEWLQWSGQDDDNDT